MTIIAAQTSGRRKTWALATDRVAEDGAVWVCITLETVARTTAIHIGGIQVREVGATNVACTTVNVALTTALSAVLMTLVDLPCYSASLVAVT